jgi:hypothetical protein
LIDIWVSYFWLISRFIDEIFNVVIDFLSNGVMIFVRMFYIFILGFIDEVGCFMDECNWVIFSYFHEKSYLVMIAKNLYYHLYLLHRLSYLILRFLIFEWIISLGLMFLLQLGRFLWFIVKFIEEVFQIIFIVCHWLLS